MNAGLLDCRRRLITLVVALMLAVSAAYVPVLLDQVAGTAFTPQALACQPGSSGCG